MSLITRVGAHHIDANMRIFDRKSLSYLESDWKNKDCKITAALPSLKEKAGEFDIYTNHIIGEFTPLSNQGNAGTCAANAWADMLEMLLGLDGQAVKQLSRRFLYWTSRYLTADTNKDDGTFLRSCAHQLNKIGIVEEQYFRYSDDPIYLLNGNKEAEPELDLYTMASDNLLSAFYKPDATTPDALLNQLELVIRSNHPFVFGTNVGQEFMNYRGGGTVFAPPTTSKGGHAMICVGVGYDGQKRWWLLRNSWGSGWGDAGHAKINDDYVLSFEDIWVGTLMSSIL